MARSKKIIVYDLINSMEMLIPEILLNPVFVYSQERVNDTTLINLDVAAINIIDVFDTIENVVLGDNHEWFDLHKMIHHGLTVNPLRSEGQL